MNGLNTDAALMLEDNGPTKNLVLHKIAEKLGLAKRPTTVFLKVIKGEYRQLETFIYQLEVVEPEQVGHQIEAIVVDSITEVGHVEGVPSLWGFFPTVPQVAVAAFGRPHGKWP